MVHKRLDMTRTTTLRIAEISLYAFLSYAQHIVRVFIIVLSLFFPIHYEWAGVVVYPASNIDLGHDCVFLLFLEFACFCFFLFSKEQDGQFESHFCIGRGHLLLLPYLKTVSRYSMDI